MILIIIIAIIYFIFAWVKKNEICEMWHVYIFCSAVDQMKDKITHVS